MPKESVGLLPGLASLFLAFDPVAASVAVTAQVTATGQVFLPAQINDSRTPWFMLDTAAPTSADPALVRELKLKAGGGYRGKGSGAASVDLLRLPEATLRIGAYTMRGSLFGTPVKQLEPALGRKIDGILGSELFTRGPVEIDFRNRTVRLRGRGERSRLPLDAPQRKDTVPQPGDDAGGIGMTQPDISLTNYFDWRIEPPYRSAGLFPGTTEEGQ